MTKQQAKDRMMRYAFRYDGKVPHLYDMVSRITDDFSEGKMMRWLGYMQGVLGPHGQGLLTLEQLKEDNRSPEGE